MFNLNKSNLVSLVERVFFYALLLTPCTFILPIKISNTAIVILIVSWILLSVVNPKRENIQFRNLVVPALLFLYMLLQITSLLYSENIPYGLKNIETKLSIIIFPLILFFGKGLALMYRSRELLLLFAQGIFIVCLYIIIRISIISDGLEVAWGQYTFENLSGLISVHPGYFSLYVSFSVLILIIYFNSFSHWTKIGLLIQIIVFAIFIFRLTARMPMIGLIAGISIYVLFGKRFFLQIIFIIGLTSAIFFIANSDNPDIKERLHTPVRLIISGDLGGLENYVFNRLQIYSCAIEVLSWPTFIYGVGVGDANDCLMKCYDSHNYSWVSSQNYNAHNEYLQTSLEVGLIGFLILLFLMIYPIKFWKKQPLFLLFTVLFGLFSLTESTLQVQKGVVFFSFFYSLFASFAGKYQLDHNE